MPGTSFARARRGGFPRLAARRAALVVTLVAAGAWLAPSSGAAAAEPWPARADAIRLAALAGRWEQAARDLARWADEARRTGDAREAARASVARARVMLERHSYHRRDPRGVERALLVAHARARAAGDSAAFAEALHGLGRWAYGLRLEGLGDWEAVAARLDSARVLRERLPGAPGLAESYFYLGLVQQMTQHLDEAERWFGRALEEARATDDLVEQSNAHRHLGFVRQIAGDLTVAREHYQASLRLRESADAAVLVPFARVLLAQFEVETGGDTAAAIARLEEAGRVAQRSRSRRGAMSAAFMLADLQAARGRLAAAGAALQRAEAEARAYGDPAALQDARRRRAALAGGPR